MKTLLTKINESKTTYVAMAVFVLSVLFLVLPFFISAQPLGEGEGIVPECGWLGCGFCEFSLMLDNFVRYALFNFAFPLGVVGIIISGVIFLTASGNQQRITTGKKAMNFVVMGIVIAFGAWLLIDLTLGNLLDPGYKPWQEFPGCGVPPTPTPVPTPTPAPTPCIPEECEDCFVWDSVDCRCEPVPPQCFVPHGECCSEEVCVLGGCAAFHVWCQPLCRCWSSFEMVPCE